MSRESDYRGRIDDIERKDAHSVEHGHAELNGAVPYYPLDLIEAVLFGHLAAEESRRLVPPDSEEE